MLLIQKQLSIQQKGDRAVIQQTDLHIGPKTTGGDITMTALKCVDQGCETRDCLRRWRCRRKTGPHSGIGIGGQRELADHKHAAGNRLHRKIHLAFGIIENSVSKQALGHSFDALRRIAWFDGDESQQSRSDGTNKVAADFDLRMFDTLDKGNHAIVEGMVSEQKQLDQSII